MRSVRIILTVCLLAAISIPVYAQSIVASVNGEKITKAELDRRVKLEYGKGEEQRILDDIINEKILLQLARKLGCSPTEAQIDKRIAAMKKGVNLEASLKAKRMTMSDLRHKVRLDVANNNILFRGVKVTDSEVLAEYNKHKDYFTVPEQKKVCVITTPSKTKAQQAYEKLKKGEKFEAVATWVAGRETAGSIGWIRKNQQGLAPNYKNEVFRLKKGQYSAPVELKTPGAPSEWAIIKILDHKPQTVKPYSEAKEEVKEGLLFAKGRKKNNVIQLVREARGKAKIVIYDKNFKSLQR